MIERGRQISEDFESRLEVNHANAGHSPGYTYVLSSFTKLLFGMPHSTVPSNDTLPSLTSEDSETPSIGVAQAIQKHQSQILNIPTRNDSPSGMHANTSVFSFEEQPLPTIPPPQDIPNYPKDDIPTVKGSTSSAGSEATAVPYQPTAPAQTQNSAHRYRYFEEQFAYKDHPSTAQERITRNAPVIAELRTNVIVCEP